MVLSKIFKHTNYTVVILIELLITIFCTVYLNSLTKGNFIAGPFITYVFNVPLTVLQMTLLALGKSLKEERKVRVMYISSVITILVVAMLIFYDTQNS